MKIGYARVSTQEQNLDLQLDALKDAGCEQVFTDKISGSKKKRPGLDELKHILRRGDKVIVWKLDRLGRILPDLINLVNYFDAKGAEFQSLQDRIDTSTPVGQFASTLGIESFIGYGHGLMMQFIYDDAHFFRLFLIL